MAVFTGVPAGAGGGGLSLLRFGSYNSGNFSVVCEKPIQLIIVSIKHSYSGGTLATAMATPGTSFNEKLGGLDECSVEVIANSAIVYIEKNAETVYYACFG